MPTKNNAVNKKYWEENIEGFSGFYDTKSEENINGIKGFTFLYKKLIFPLEKKFMLDRYNMVCDYINQNVKPGMKVADIGCGSGVFTKMMIKKGAYVYALDYVESAVSLTKKNLTEEELKSAEVIQLDILTTPIPKVDIAISIGVLPYIDEVDIYLANILPCTNLFLFNYLKKDNLLNLIRRNLHFLDVRNYSYHGSEDIREKLAISGFEVLKETKLATGLMIESKRK